MNYQHVTFPEQGTPVSMENGILHVPDQPWIGYVEGDGIGRDITRATHRIVNAAVDKVSNGAKRIHWVETFLGEKAAALYDGNYFPDETLEAIKELKIAIKGPLTTPVGEGFRSLNVSLRQTLDLYACVRPVRHYAGVPSPVKEPGKIDVVIFRENTEDVYAGIEYASGSEQNKSLANFLRQDLHAKFFEDAGLGIKPISPFASKRLVRKAIRYAIDHGRESVTLVHKGNIMKYTEGAFRGWGYDLAREEFPDQTISENELYEDYHGKLPAGKILIKDRIADIIFQLMLLRPEEFDVLATMNLNGDYLSDAIAAQVGGVGIAPGANIGDEVAVFEATHGTAPKYANKDVVNPGSLLFSAVEMLEYMGWTDAAELIRLAYEETILDRFVTYDFARQMHGATEVSTSAFADAVIERIQRGINVEAHILRKEQQQQQERKLREQRRIRTPAEEKEASGHKPTTVDDIMSRNLITIAPDATVEQALKLMGENDISGLLVDPEQGGQWAIMTRRDVVSRIIQANRNTMITQVREIATKPIITVDANMSIHDCADMMMIRGIRRVVVSQNNEPIGMVSETDIVRSVEEFGWIRGE